MALAVKSKYKNLPLETREQWKEKTFFKHINEWSLQGVRNTALFSFENIHEYQIEKIK